MIFLKKIFLLAFLTWLNSLYAFSQDTWKLVGQVSDSTRRPLATASVYATSTDSLNTFLAFGSSDENGIFTLILDKKVGSVMLHASYLGYEPYKILILQKNNIPNWDIVLAAQKYNLPEIVVSARPSDIIQRNDTTTYQLKYFRDSSEYSVEDILKKLPGVTVKDNGEISVNGKAIDKVLVEGSDMFGHQYTIGTKNIRADFIDQVQVIDRYQDNPVLKNVRFSDAMVLNLKISDTKKNVISGSLDLGAGWGQEWKTYIHSNVFSFSKKAKIIFLGNANNIGQANGAEEIASTYSNGGEKDWKTAPQKTPDFIPNPNIENAGLQPTDVDNGKNTLLSLRSEFNLPQDWILSANTTLGRKKDTQTTDYKQVFSFDNRYEIETKKLLNLNNRFLETELSLQKFNAARTRSFQIFTKLATNLMSSQQNVTKIEENKIYFLQNKFYQENPSGFLSVNYTQKLSENSAIQYQLKAQQAAKPQNFSTANADFPSYFLLDSSYYFLNQRSQFRHRELEFLTKYNFIFRQFPTEISAKYSQSSTDFEVRKELLNDVKTAILLPFSYNSTSSKQIESNAKISYEWTNSVTIIGALQAAWRKSETVSSSASPTAYFLPSVSSKITFQKRWSAIQEMNVGYWLSNFVPANYDLFSANYFTDNFTCLLNNNRISVTKKHKIFISYRRQDLFNSRNYNFFASYQLLPTVWGEQIAFDRSLQVIQPFLSQQPNKNWTVNGNFEQFFQPIKTRFALNIAYGQNFTQSLIFPKNINFFQQSFRSKTSVKIFLFRTNAQLHLEHTFLQTYSSIVQNAASPNVNKANLLEIRFLYKWKAWRLSYVLNKNIVQNSTQQAVNWQNSHFKISKNVLLFRQKTNIELGIYNLENNQQYRSLQNDALFTFSSSVESVARFFFLKFDFSI